MKKISAAEKLHARLKEEILSRQYLPGDRLPSEREIMRQKKIGRSTVREAYCLLQQEGLVETRHGGGAYVAQMDSAKVGDALATLIRHGGVSFSHIFEFRGMVETQCAAFAAERATPDQIFHLRRMVDEMEAVYGLSSEGNLKFYEMELALHVQLARITGNPIFEWFNTTFKQNAMKFAQMLLSMPEKPAEAIRDWRELLCAMENNEASRAGTIMRVHCYRFQMIMQELNH